MDDQTVIHIKRSEFAQKFLPLDGNKYSLEEYPMLPAIYDSEARQQVLKFSRQAGKSTYLAMNSVSRAAMIPHFKVLYVAPRVDQAKIFSTERVKPIIDQSQFIKDYYFDSDLSNSVFTKKFLNSSTIFIRYAFLGADHLRGITADYNLFDETQDQTDKNIDVITETMKHSKYKRTVYVGTPKRSKGALARRWFSSSMNEFMIKCTACNHWNLLGEDNIGKLGVICSRCGRALNLRNGEWISTCPGDPSQAKLEGWRLSALHFANHFWINWDLDIVQKRETTSRAIFLNEVLALEHDDGVAPITEMEIQRACLSGVRLTEAPGRDAEEYRGMMGVDYGPINSENSHTVASVVQFRNDTFHVIYLKKFLGKESDYSFIHNELPRLMSVWNCSHLAADYGMGEASNAEIGSRIGKERVLQFQHHDSQKETVKYNPKMPAYILNRSAVMNLIFTLIKRGKIKFPDWEDFKTFSDDLLNIQQEFNEEKNKVKYINIGPDDAFHAICYPIIALIIAKGIDVGDYLKLDNSE